MREPRLTTTKKSFSSVIEFMLYHIMLPVKIHKGNFIGSINLLGITACINTSTTLKGGI